MTCAPYICLSEFCFVDAYIFTFVLPVRPQTWLHSKDVGVPDLRRHVGCSRGEHIPECSSSPRAFLAMGGVRRTATATVDPS